MKAKFNAIDFIIILVIAAIIAVGSYYLVSTMGGGTSGKSAGGNVKATFEIEFANKEEYLTEMPENLATRLLLALRKRCRLRLQM